MTQPTTTTAGPDAAGFYNVSEPAALHLFALVQRYNATVGTGAWREFWNRLENSEATMLVRVIRANCDGKFGARMHLTGLPVEFAQVTRRKKITAAIREEFEAINSYAGPIVAVNELRQAWECEYPDITALLKQHGHFDLLFEGDQCFDSSHVYDVVAEVLLKHGQSIVNVPAALADETEFAYWAKNYAMIFTAFAGRVGPWTVADPSYKAA